MFTQSAVFAMRWTIIVLRFCPEGDILKVKEFLRLCAHSMMAFAMTLLLGLGVTLAVSGTASAQTVEVVSSGAPSLAPPTYNQPSDVAFDSAGNMYVADTGNRRVIRIAAVGGAQTLYGSGYIFPYGIAFDSADNLYVADLNNQIRRVAAGNGAVTLIGSGFSSPEGVAVDAAGNVYVADGGNGSVKRINAVGGAVTTLATGINVPSKLVLDAAGNIFVAGQGETTIKRIDAGTLAVTNVGSGFSAVRAVAVDGQGNVFVSLSSDGIKVVAPNGAITTLATGISSLGIRSRADGNLYVANWTGTNPNSILRIVGVTRAAGSAVPTLSEWAMILFGLILAGGAAVLVQRRRTIA